MTKSFVAKCPQHHLYLYLYLYHLIRSHRRKLNHPLPPLHPRIPDLTNWLPTADGTAVTTAPLNGTAVPTYFHRLKVSLR